MSTLHVALYETGQTTLVSLHKTDDAARQHIAGFIQENHKDTVGRSTCPDGDDAQAVLDWHSETIINGEWFEVHECVLP